MFKAIKRMAFITKFAADYYRMYGVPIQKVQVDLGQIGWPVNEFIDWFMAANSQTMSFCEFMEVMRRWVMLDDTTALEELGKWSQEPKVRSADTKGMVGWLGAMVQGARER